MIIATYYSGYCRWKVSSVSNDATFEKTDLTQLFIEVRGVGLGTFIHLGVVQVDVPLEENRSEEFLEFNCDVHGDWKDVVEQHQEDEELPYRYLPLHEDDDSDAADDDDDGVDDVDDDGVDDSDDDDGGDDVVDDVVDDGVDDVDDVDDDGVDDADDDDDEEEEDDDDGDGSDGDHDDDDDNLILKRHHDHHQWQQFLLNIHFW